MGSENGGSFTVKSQWEGEGEGKDFGDSLTIASDREKVILM